MKSNIKFVDLDLPSGTLWADRNLGANEPLDDGLLVPWCCKKIACIEHLEQTITGIADPVTRILGPNYSLPTRDDFEELRAYTVINAYEKCVTFTSIKNNKNEIVIPFAGYRDITGKIINDNPKSFWLWSSTFNKEHAAYVMGGDSELYIDALRFIYGHSVRIVKKNGK